MRAQTTFLLVCSCPKDAMSALHLAQGAQATRHGPTTPCQAAPRLLAAQEGRRHLLESRRSSMFGRIAAFKPAQAQRSYRAAGVAKVGGA